MLPVLLFSLSSCGGGGSAILSIEQTVVEDFQLQLLDESFLGASPTGDFTLEIKREAAELEARISVTGATGLKACFFKLGYDDTAYDPLGVQLGSILGYKADLGQDDNGQLLHLEILNDPGIVQCGQVLIHPDGQDGFTGNGLIATVRFGYRPFTPRSVSEPPVSDASQTDANWDAASQTLTWRYVCQGDYNQDGMTNIIDITSLAQNWNELGPFAPNSYLQIVDGNGDGLINISDITSIAQGFNRFVEGYEVYASSNPDDLPADNSEPSTLQPMDFVPFSEHLGNPMVEQLTYYREYPELEPGTIAWVRPVSEDQAGTPSTAEFASAYDWTIHCPSAYSSVETNLNHISLANISGLPAILYMEYEEQQLVYQRALDEKGMVWDSEVVVDASANSYLASSLIDVHGHPAVCHHESETGLVEYVRSENPAGSIWGEPIVIATTASGGWDCHLLMVNEHPAVCYADFASAQLYYARAADPFGESWEDPIVVADLGSSTPVAGSWSSPAMVAEHPAIAFYHPEAQELRYIRSDDPNGEIWGSTAMVASGADVGRYCSLAYIHDFPAISYLGDNGLAYARALDAVGDTWSIQEIDSRFGAVDHLDTSLALIGGHPAISYYSGQPSADLLFVRAVDPFGEIWESPQAIDTYNMAGRSACLLDQDEFPVVAYIDESARQVMFAHSGTGLLYPPVALLSAYPSPAGVGEEVTLDASLSYAQQGEIESFEWDLDDDGTFEMNTGQEPFLLHSYETPGRYPVHIRITDQHEMAAEDSLSMQVGELGSPPIAVLTADPLDAVLGQNIHFSAEDSLNDDGTIVQYEWDLHGDGDFEIDGGIVTDVDFEYSTEGVFNAAVRVTNDLGLTDIASVCINIGVLNERPVAELTASPQSGNPPFLVNLDGSASSDPDGSITNYEWDLDNDGLFEHNGGLTATLQWQCEQHGDQRVRMRVTDNLQAKDTVWVLIGSNQAPVAKLTASAYNGNAPYLISLDCSGSYDPDGSIVKWGIDVQSNGRYEFLSAGQPTSWNFMNVWNGPTKVRLAVKDNEGAISTAVITVNAAKGWHIRTIDPFGYTGIYNSLEICYGQPAIAYFEWHSRSLKYVRATDTYGYNPWATPVNLGALGPVGAGGQCGRLSLAWADGTWPVIAFHSWGLQDYYFYAIAKDSQGASWHPFVAGSNYYFHKNPNLRIVNLKPALVYQEFLGGVKFGTAKDSQGFQWNNPVVVDKKGSDPTMGIVNGNPVIMYSKGVSGGGGTTVNALLYIRATKPDGSSWGVPVVIDNPNNPGAGCGQASLTIIGGRPAVAYVAAIHNNQVGYVVRYKRADNQNGTSWTSPPKVVKTDGTEVLGLVEINSKPAIGLVTCQGHDVMYFLANDTVGNSWPPGYVVDDLAVTKGLVGTPPVGEMIGINGHPAMSYFDPGKGELKYAVLE